MTDINLYQHFADLNVKLFDGVLNDIELRWRHTVTRGGCFVSRTIMTIENGKRSYRKEAQYIEVSSHLCKTEESVRSVLAHEMIHQYIAQKDIRDTAVHGMHFNRILRKLNEKDVVKITFMTED